MICLLFILCTGISATGISMSVVPPDPFLLRLFSGSTVVFGLLTWVTWP